LFYPTQIDEKTRILVEAETSGAFVKSDIEELPDPETAVVRAIQQIGVIGKQIGEVVGKQFEGTGTAFEVTFSMKLDAVGLVLLAQSPESGQFKVSVIRGG
jgi:hypothetical protein